MTRYRLTETMRWKVREIGMDISLAWTGMLVEAIECAGNGDPTKLEHFCNALDALGLYSSAEKLRNLRTTPK